MTTVNGTSNLAWTNGNNRNDDENFEVGCSDDEKYEFELQSDGEWQLPSSKIVELYEKLASEVVLELEWESPGRRPPTPLMVGDTRQNEQNDRDMKLDEGSGFEFEDEMGEVVSVRGPVGERGPRGSAKKKTTSLDAILSSMARHRRLDQDMMEHDTDPKHCGET